MDYLKRLENSVTNFEAETSKLLKINKLIQDTEKLINEVSKEGEILKKSSSQLETLKLQITEDCNTLTEFVENETAERQKLIADIHKKFIEDSNAVIEKLSIPLKTSGAQIDENCKLIRQFIETHEKSQEKFLSAIESLLIKYNSKNLEVYNNIINVLSNKIDVARDNIETNLNLKMNNCIQEISNLNNRVEQNSTNLDSKIEKNTSAMHKEISGISDELITTMQEILSTIKYIKIAVSLALGTGIAACVINFIK